ncbi:1034_t:CDS:2 [Ambispora gerdemannii]|uniref:1034_t:CDS:1 n=1 Tax=Ambispora gerdemannii TaxID=144530 RepID=A0A9N8W0N9_9GLOM|nr:1034_t:CDS:2 [Ambispora gerdemannii]
MSEVTNTNKGEASFYEFDTEKTILSLKIPENLLSQWFKGRTIALFICLDISGSMSGEPIKQAKQAILELLEGVFSSGACTEQDITCFFFDHNCTVVPFANDPELRWDNGGIQRYFKDKVNIRGGTDFTHVYREIVKHMPTVHTDLAVIFFTDGQTSKVQDQDNNAISSALSTFKHGTEVHTIGFSRYHDAAILSWLTKLGTKQGNFQYVETTVDIGKTMKTTLELLSLGDRNIFVKIGDNEAIQTAFDNEGCGRLVLTEENKSVRGKKVTILKDQEATGLETFTIESLRQVNEGDAEATLLTIPVMQSEITRLTNEIINNTGNREKLDEIKEQAENYDANLNIILEKSFKLKSAFRNETIRQCMDVKAMLHRFKDLLSDALKGTLSNEKIANFNNLAYKNVTQQRLKKKLDNRAIKNVDQMDAIEERLKNLVQTIDFDELDRTETEENKLTYACLLTTDNYIEAMREGECMCLTLDIGRSQAAIADPTQLIIKKINQTFMSSDAFMNSVRYALEETSGGDENVHGGFQGPSFSASVIQGIAREDITGILPLYINEKHWQIAKERIKPILGYMTTLDVFGYAYSQLTTVPFLVLGKALGDTSTDFRRKQLTLILDTCRALYKQSTYLREENKTLFEKYTKSPLNRTVDSVANHVVLLGHILCALQLGDITLTQVQQYLQEGLFTYAIEETIRRRLNRALPGIEEKFDDIQKFLGIDQKSLIDEPIKEFSESYAAFIKKAQESTRHEHNRYSIAFKTALGMKIDNTVSQESTVMDINALVPPTVRNTRYNGSSYTVPGSTSELLSKTQQLVLETVELILRFKQLFEWLITNNTTDITKFTEFYKFAPEKTPFATQFFAQLSPKARLATFIQAYKHRQNSARREAAKATPTTFFEPFSDATADQIISLQFDEYVSDQLKRQVDKIIDSYNKLTNNAVGLAFWQANSADEAAGVLMLDVKFRGAKVYTQAIKALQKPQTELAKEKIEMLIKGTWKGVKLFQDDFSKLPEKEIWIPSRQNLYRIIIAQKGSVNAATWIELLPSYKSYIEHQFDDEYLARRLHEAWEERELKRGH